MPFVTFKGTSTGSIQREINVVNTQRLLVLEHDSNNDQTLLLHHNNYPLSCIYAVQDKAWMDEKLMIVWVEKVEKVYTKTINRTTLLILDVFRGHMTSKVRRAIELCNTIIVYIPGGYTSKLQTMDVGLNKPFKTAVHDSYTAWFKTNHIAQRHEQQRLQQEHPDNIIPLVKVKQKKHNVSEWIAISWYNNIKIEEIINTWRHIGFINNNEQAINNNNEIENNDNVI